MEALQKMSDPLLSDCPSCESPALRKQLTAAAFKLKGTGWYETDFKNSGAKAATADTPQSNKVNDQVKASESADSASNTAPSVT